MRFLRRKALIAALVFTGALATTAFVFEESSHVATGTLPERLSDTEFWALVQTISEPGGFFRSDNFVSNELTYQHVIPELQKRVEPGGVYVGVGPDQNFTYIAHLRPKIVFIADIRKQNMLQHLLFKSLFERSANRTEYLEALFSRDVPKLPDHPSIEVLADAVAQATPDPKRFEANRLAVREHLTETHGFGLTESELTQVDYVYRAFFEAGPEIRYSFGSFRGARRFPSFRDLVVETDEQGRQLGYLANDENFSTIRSLHRNNLIVPVVGDFGGSHALRAIAAFLRDHGATLTAFYTSNVEFYLFQGDAWRRFYANVREMPHDEKSTFIRAYFNNYGYRFGSRPAGFGSVTALDPVSAVIKDFEQGRFRSYSELMNANASRLP